MLSPKDQHKVKMQAKRILRARTYARDGNANPYIPANLGRKHPDYGMSMKDHEKEKAARNTQKSS